MTELEFCSEPDSQAIAHAHAEEPATIPNVGDRAYVPRNKNARVHLQIAGREFLYDDLGTLSTVKLSCILLPDDEVSDLSQEQRPIDNSLTLGRPLSTGNAPKAELPFSCPRCACLMTLHQPDPELSECLLAICEYCKAWYLTNPTETKLSLIRQPRERPSRQ